MNHLLKKWLVLFLVLGLALAGNTRTVSAAESSGIRSGMTKGYFRAGTTVAFDNAAFVSQYDGIYLFRDGEMSMLNADDMWGRSGICTDGYRLYYVNAYGALVELTFSYRLDIIKYEVISQEVEPGSSVVGVNDRYVYVVTPDVLDMETGVLDEFGDFVTYSRSTGKEAARLKGYSGECAGGLTYAYERGFDVSPRWLHVYDSRGKEAAEEEFCRCVSVYGNAVYYYDGTDPADYRDGEYTLYRVDESGVHEVMTRDSSGEMVYSNYFGGFFTRTMVDARDGYSMEYVDLRDGQVIPGEFWQKGEEDLVYWTGSQEHDGRDYLFSYKTIDLMTQAGPQSIYVSPIGLEGSHTYLVGESILVETSDNEYYIFPLDPETTVQPITVIVTPSVPQEEEHRGYLWPKCSWENIGVEAWAHEKLAEALNTRRDEAEKLVHEEEDALIDRLTEEHGKKAAGDVYADLTVTPARSDTKVFSYLMKMESGSRKYSLSKTRYMGVNINSETGEDILLSDVTADGEALEEAILQKAGDLTVKEENRIRKILRTYLEDEPADSGDELCWTLGYEDVTFRFPLEEPVRVTLDFVNHKKLFREEYQNVPAAYAWEVDPEEEGIEFPKDDEAAGRVMAVRTRDGQHLCYVFEDIGENEGTVRVYQVSSLGKAKYIGEEEAMYISGSTSGDVFFLPYRMTDPEKFILIQATGDGPREFVFAAGEDGLPVPADITGNSRAVG